MSKSQGFSATLFAAAALAFLLPFGTVSCNEPPTTFTGLQLATATVHGDDREMVAQVENDGFGLALIAGVSCLTGLGLALAGRRGQGRAALVGLLSLLLLTWIAAFDMAEFTVGDGFTLACLALTCVVGIRATLLLQRRRTAHRRVWPAVLGLITLALFLLITVSLISDSGPAADAKGYAVLAASSSTAGTSLQRSSSL